MGARHRTHLKLVEGCDRRFSATVAFHGLDGNLRESILLKHICFVPDGAWATNHLWVTYLDDVAQLREVRAGDKIIFTAYVHVYGRADGSADYALSEFSHVVLDRRTRSGRSGRTGAEKRLRFLKENQS